MITILQFVKKLVQSFQLQQIVKSFKIKNNSNEIFIEAQIN